MANIYLGQGDAYMALPSKRYAIQIANEREFNAAVKYFERLGYKPMGECSYNGNYTRYVAINDIGNISGSDGTFVYYDGLVVYQWADLLQGKDPEMETPIFEVGDIVSINDGSFNILIEKGSTRQLCGLYCKKTSWKVLCANAKWPITDGLADSKYMNEKHKQNDLLVSDINDVNRFLITNSVFCTLLHRTPKPIMIGKNEVRFNKDGSITVGCTNVDKETLKKIMEKL